MLDLEEGLPGGLPWKVFADITPLFGSRREASNVRKESLGPAGLLVGPPLEFDQVDGGYNPGLAESVMAMDQDGIAF